MRVAKTTFKDLLASGRQILATFLQIPAPEMAEIVGCAGFDAGIVDGEHGMLTLDAARQIFRACDAVGLVPVFRVPRLDHQGIGHALDMGASAIMVPNITSRDQAEQAVRAAKFHPRGDRGICPFTRAARYDAADSDPDFYGRSNRETAVILQVEGLEGLENLESILEVPDVACIFVGPFDLSQSLGIPGQVTDERVLSAIRRIVNLADRKGVAVGNFAIDHGQAQRCLDMGVRLMAFASDTLIVTRAFKQLRKDLVSLTHREHEPARG